MIRPVHPIAFALLGALFISTQMLGQTQSGGNEARNLMEEARAARAAGDHAKALSLASQAGEIQMTPDVRLFIAEEQRQVGDITGAMSNAEACLMKRHRPNCLIGTPFFGRAEGCWARCSNRPREW